MTASDPHSPRRRGLTLDVWCDPAEELPVLESELAALDSSNPRGPERKRLAALQHELGRLQLHRGDDAAAAQAFLGAYSLAPRFRPNLRTAQGLYEMRRDYRLLVKLVGAEAAASKDPALRAGLLRRQAHLLWTRLEQPGQAREVLTEAHKHSPGDLTTLKLLEILCAAMGDLTGVEQQLRMQIRLLPPSSQTAALLTCRALLAASTNPDKALTALRRAIELDPSMPAAGCFLEQVLEERGDSQELARLLEDLSRQEGVAPERRAQLLARAARGRGPISTASTQELFQESLAAHLSPEVAEDLLEALLRQGDTEGAMEVGERLLSLELPPLEARRISAELGEVNRALLNNPEAAARWYRCALELDPGHPPALEGMELLLGRGGELGELLELRQRALDAARHPLDRLTGLLAVAQLLEQDGQTEPALEAHGQLLSRWPDFSASQLSQERLFTRLQRWTELLQLYDEMLTQAADDQQTTRILERMAAVWQYQLGQAESALECHHTILAGNPQHLPSIRAAARICARVGKYDELVRLNEQEVALTVSPARKADLLCGTARIWSSHLSSGREDSGERARHCYLQALAEDPGCAEALQALRQLYRQSEDWSGLARLLEERLSQEEDPGEKIPLLGELAAVQQRELSLNEDAAATYSRLLKLTPGRRSVVEPLARLHREAGRWAEAAALLEEAAGACSHKHSAAGWLVEAATLNEERLDQVEEAARLYREALAARPSMAAALLGLDRLGEEAPAAPVMEEEPAAGGPEDAEVTRTLKVRLTSAAGTRSLLLDGHHGASGGQGELSLRAMERSLRMAGDQEKLEVLLRERVQRGGDALERACLHAELAELAVARKDNEAAERCFKEALACYEGHPGALWGMARLLTKQKRWPEVIHTFLREAETMESPRCRHDALIRAALVLEDRTGERTRAVELYRQVLDEEPLHDEANERLAQCLEAEEQWLALASLLRARINATTSPDATASYLCRLGRVYMEHLGEEGKGLACLRRAAELDPDNKEVHIALADQHYARQEWAEAEEIYTRTISAVAEPRSRARINRRLGEIQLGMDMPLAALSSLKLVEEDQGEPDQETLNLMLQAAKAAREQQTQPTVTRRLLELVDDPGERVSLLKEAARLIDEEAGDPEEAIAMLEEAIALAPLDIQTIESLAAVHGSRGDREVVDRHLSASAARVRQALAGDDLSARLYQQLGRIYKWQRQYDALFCTCIARTYLEAEGKEQGLLDEAERRFLKLHQYRSAPVPAGRLATSRYEQLLLPAASQVPLRRLLLLCRPALHKLIASRPESLGLEQSDMLAVEHPLRTLCNETSAQLGGVEFDLYISRSRRRLIAAEMLERPALIIGSDVAQGLISPAERFRIGRALFLIGEGALPLLDMTVQRARILITALGRAARPTCDLPLGEQGEPVDRETARLVDFLDEGELERLGASLPKVAGDLEGADLGQFKAALLRGANRAGLAVAGDPLRALEESGRLEDVDGIGPLTADLLTFLLDPRFLTLRRELGIAPGAAD